MNLKNKIINLLTKNGNKAKSENVFLKSIKNMQKTTTKSSSELVKLAVINSTPSIELKEVKQKKRKTRRYLPFVLGEKNRTNKALKTLVTYSKIKKPIWLGLGLTLTSTLEIENEIQKNNLEKHKTAILKKKYVKFRWFF